MTRTHDDAPAASLEVPLDRDRFFRNIISELTGALQDVVGLDEASGFVSLVGQRMGRQMDADYRAAAGIPRLSKEQVGEVLVDLKRRIGGDFSVESIDEERIVLRNRTCPFGAYVHGRSAMCMMTSNVFGAIAADNLGYAKVELQETIAEGHGGCTVVVHLRPSAGPGREYVRGPDEG